MSSKGTKALKTFRRAADRLPPGDIYPTVRATRDLIFDVPHGTDTEDLFQALCDLANTAGAVAGEIDRLRKDRDKWRQTAEDLYKMLHGKTEIEEEDATPPEPVDVNGEVLKVGDLVVPFNDPYKNDPYKIEIVTSLEIQDYPPSAQRGSISTDWQKITDLTRLQYLPLARRTLDPSLEGKALLAFLRDGVIGEWGELWKALQEGDTKKVLDECGDVLWYAEQLFDLVDQAGAPYEIVNLSCLRDWPGLIEATKKEIYHGSKSGVLFGIADDAIASVMRYASDHGSDDGAVRYQNIKKLLERYPDGFVSVGGER